ncbi:MAG: universal stress protein [ANME-2 cluster archaeon]|nr:universal stress protein [ANME-2 cluster archaeon]
MKILLPIDGSEFSKKAAQVALRISKHHSAHIVLLHVIASSGQERKKWMEEGADKLLEVYTKSMVDDGLDGAMITSLIEDGDPADQIIQTAELNGVDRIIMGTHGKTGLKKITGSVTEKVLRNSKVLVLGVPPNYEI